MIPATRRLRVEKSRYNQSPGKRKSEQQKHAIEERSRRDPRTKETHKLQKKTEEEEEATIQRRKTGKRNILIKKKNTDKNVKELLNDETISKSNSKGIGISSSNTNQRHTLASIERVCSM